MTREEFIQNYIAAERAVHYADNATVRICQALIGSIYDLQQQIAQKDEFIEYLDGRLISLEQEVYK